MFSQLSPDPVIESISAGNYRSFGGETIDEERKRKRKEQEEKRRRIEESQRRAAMEKNVKAKERDDTADEVVVTRREKMGPESTWDGSEKRRSLLDMWESMSEPHTNSNEQPEKSEEIEMVLETVVRSSPDTETFQV